MTEYNHVPIIFDSDKSRTMYLSIDGAWYPDFSSKIPFHRKLNWLVWRWRYHTKSPYAKGKPLLNVIKDCINAAKARDEYIEFDGLSLQQDTGDWIDCTIEGWIKLSDGTEPGHTISADSEVISWDYDD